MTDTSLSDIPEQVKKRVRNDPESYISRDLDLTRKYRFGDEIENEPVKAIQKEIDGMARLLCAIVVDSEDVDDIKRCTRIYQAEVEELRRLEERVISELPEREERE